MSLLDNIMFDLFTTPFDAPPEMVFAPTVGEMSSEISQKIQQNQEMREQRARLREEQMEVEKQSLRKIEATNKVQAYLNDNTDFGNEYGDRAPSDHTENANKLIKLCQDRDTQYIAQSVNDTNYTIDVIVSDGFQRLTTFPTNDITRIVFDNFFAERDKNWKIYTTKNSDVNEVIYKLFNIVQLQKPKLAPLSVKFSMEPFSFNLPVEIQELDFVDFEGNMFLQALVCVKGIEWYKMQTKSQLQKLELAVEYT